MFPLCVFWSVRYLSVKNTGVGDLQVHQKVTAGTVDVATVTLGGGG